MGGGRVSETHALWLGWKTGCASGLSRPLKCARVDAGVRVDGFDSGDGLIGAEIKKECVHGLR